MGTIDPKLQAELDQSAKTLGDNIPCLIWSLYEGFQNQGFDSQQALELCKTYLQSMVRGANA